MSRKNASTCAKITLRSSVRD